MMALSGNEREFRKNIQKDVEIPAVVQDKMNQVYYMIESNTVVQKEAEKDGYHWLKLGGKVVGGVAAAFVIGVVFCAQNPVMAKNIPVVGSLFEFLQDKVSFFGDFAGHAISLENSDEAKTEDGMTISCSEVFANSQAIYVTMQCKSDEPFPATEVIGENGRPDIELDITGEVDFNSNADSAIDGQVEGRFLDDHTYACILRYDLEKCSKR